MKNQCVGEGVRVGGWVLFIFIKVIFLINSLYIKKTNTLLLADCRHLVHLFSCRCLQMWSADCRPFPTEKTNTT
ncbi:hypothetical protein Hanom_Chr08g00707531 [Helianthus anomalus]